MKHRHLNHERYTLAGLDDVIARGKLADWKALRDEMRRDPALAPKVTKVCRPKLSDPYAQRYHFWANYVRLR